MVPFRNLRHWIRNGLVFAVICGVVGLSGAILLDINSGRFKHRTLQLELNSGTRQSLAPVVHRLNSCFEEDWKEHQLVPVARADDLLIARRLALALAGTIPSLEEIRQLERVPAEARIGWWVDHLLRDRRTSDFLAERFARVWVGVEDGPFLVYRRRRFVSWLSDQLHANRPYDELVRDLIGATGLWTDRPEVNFVTRAIHQEQEPGHPDPVLLAGRTSRAFLGMRMDCLQCHDDFLGNVHVGSVDNPREGTQRDFHALAAFFHQSENSLTGIRDNESAPAYKTRLLDSVGDETIDPQVPILAGLLDSNIARPRERLAAWVTHRDNRAFARATVNRVWAILFGRALVQPVDDIPIEGPFPAALEVLVDDFVQHQFDLHRLIRLIALSRPFTLDSSAHFPIGKLHEEHWAIFPLTRLRPDQMAGAMLQSTQLKTIDSTSHILTQLTRFGQQNDFVARFGDPGEDEFQDRGETVTQRLLLFNGDMLAENLDNALHVPLRLNQLAIDAQTTVETVFLSTLSRRPNDSEVRRFQTQSQSEIPVSHQILDIYWAMINSAEFRWNH